MLGGTLLRWGTETQKRYFLPRIISGEDRWCQGFSEPSSGSDLASLSTRAVRCGDEWVIDGQKLWTSRAREANWMFLLARTNPAASKTGGLTFLLVPLEQPGVEVRPIPAMSGEIEFNEVFFSGATTGADYHVGEVDAGWAVATTLMGLERGEEAATNPIMFRAELDRLLRMACERGRSSDPLMRDRLAGAYIRCEIMRFLGLRILTGYLREGTLGPEASISKLYWSEYHQGVTRLALDVLGPAATVPAGRGPLRAYRTDDPGAPNTSGSWVVGATYNAVAGTLYAGTSQMQRDIIGESILGLPREPRSTSRPANAELEGPIR
jgi:alkylation response protein AidB-like acyl-CoA dehydrogenase